MPGRRGTASVTDDVIERVVDADAEHLERTGLDEHGLRSDRRGLQREIGVGCRGQDPLRSALGKELLPGVGIEPTRAF